MTWGPVDTIEVKGMCPDYGWGTTTIPVSGKIETIKVWLAKDVSAKKEPVDLIELFNMIKDVVDLIPEENRTNAFIEFDWNEDWHELSWDAWYERPETQEEFDKRQKTIAENSQNRKAEEMNKEKIREIGERALLAELKARYPDA
jgi:hypothetical protein